MPGKHAHAPFSFRLRPELRGRLAARLEQTGQARNEFINEAVEEKLDREEASGES